MFDGSYQTFERARRTPTVQVLAARNGRVLLLREKQPGLRGLRTSMPGGRMERGETALSAAKRELLEETGMVSERWSLLHTYDEGGGKMEWRIYLFLAKGCHPRAPPHPDSGERIKQEWVTIDRLLGLFTKSSNSMMVDFTRLKYDRKRRDVLRRRVA